jgi:hypothetical protein
MLPFVVQRVQAVIAQFANVHYCTLCVRNEHRTPSVSIEKAKGGQLLYLSLCSDFSLCKPPTRLKKMTVPLMASIIGEGISCQKPAHELGKPSGLLRSRMWAWLVIKAQA